MVSITLTESIVVEMTAGETKPCKYVIFHDGERISQYETSADPRTAGGQVGLRNIIYRHVSDVDKDEIAEQVSNGISNSEAAISEEFGSR